jgi:hypothetical protein
MKRTMKISEADVTLELKKKRGNPRNSEGAFITLKDGRILFAYTKFLGKNGRDHGRASICTRESKDGGRTWSKRDRVLLENEGDCNVMSVSLLRLQDGRIAFFYARKNSFLDCRPWMRISSDEGKTWSKAICCIAAPGYFVLNNDRVIQLKNGRIIVPVAYHRAKLDTKDPENYEAFDHTAISLYYFSDDGGKTWRESDNWLAHPVSGGAGLQEPGVIELKGKRLWGWARTSVGRQWEMKSTDGGNSWKELKPSWFRSPASPLSIKRCLRTGALIALWNNQGKKGKEHIDFADSSWGRTPLTMAVSYDEGKRWKKVADLETDPAIGFCYTAMHFTDDALLVGYVYGGGDGSSVLSNLRVRRIVFA